MRTPPRSGGERAGNHLQQRRLAGAVPAHDRPALAAPDRQVDAVVDHPRAVRLRHVLEHGDLFARARRLAELEVDDPPLLRQLDLLDLVERLDAALHLRRLRRVRREALDEALFLGQHRLLARVRRLAVRLADAALALVEVVVAGVDGDLAAVDLGDAVDDPVHEVAVVRRHEERAGKRLEEGLEPDDRFDVEVVRRLVEEQHVGTAEEHARHGDAHLPAAGERARRRRRSARRRTRGRAALRAPGSRARSRRDARTPPGPRRSARGSCPCRRRAPDRPSPGSAPRARGAACPTRPLPAIASSSTLRPDISSTSWRK